MELHTIEQEEDKKLKDYLDYINKDRVHIKQALKNSYKTGQETEAMMIA